MAITVPEYESQLQQRRKTLESTKGQIEQFKPDIAQTQRQLRVATPLTQARVRGVETQRKQAKKQALATVKKEFETQKKLEREFVPIKREYEEYQRALKEQREWEEAYEVATGRPELFFGASKSVRRKASTITKGFKSQVAKLQEKLQKGEKLIVDTQRLKIKGVESEAFGMSFPSLEAYSEQIGEELAKPTALEKELKMSLPADVRELTPIEFKKKMSIPEEFRQEELLTKIKETAQMQPPRQVGEVQGIPIYDKPVEKVVRAVEPPTTMLGKVEEFFKEKRRGAMKREGIPTGAGFVAGVGLTGVGIARFGAGVVTKPVQTTKEIAKGFAETGRKVITGEGFPEVGRILREEPGYAIGRVTGEAVAFKGLQVTGRAIPRVGRFLPGKTPVKVTPTLATPTELKPFVRKRATVIVRDKKGRILYELDKNTGTYILPGGAIEKGETALKSASREFFEETGIAVRNLKKVDDVIVSGERNIVFEGVVDDFTKMKPQAKEVLEFKFIKPKTYRGPTPTEPFGRKATLFGKPVRAEDLAVGARADRLANIGKQLGAMPPKKLDDLYTEARQWATTKFGEEAIVGIKRKSLIRDYVLAREGMPLQKLEIPLGPKPTVTKLVGYTGRGKIIPEAGYTKLPFEVKGPPKIQVGLVSRYDVPGEAALQYGKGPQVFARGSPEFMRTAEGAPFKVPGQEFEVQAKYFKRGEQFLFWQPPAVPKGDPYIGISYLGLAAKPSEKYGLALFGKKPVIQVTTGEIGEGFALTKKALAGVELEVGTPAETVFRLKKEYKPTYLAKKKVRIQEVELKAPQVGELTQAEIEAGLANIRKLSPKKQVEFLKKVRKETGVDYLKIGPQPYVITEEAASALVAIRARKPVPLSSEMRRSAEKSKAFLPSEYRPSKTVEKVAYVPRRAYKTPYVPPTRYVPPPSKVPGYVPPKKYKTPDYPRPEKPWLPGIPPPGIPKRKVFDRDDGVRRKVVNGELFLPFVRRRGKFIPVGQPVRFRKAKARGIRELRKTLGASLQIQRVKTGELVKFAKESKEFRVGKREGAVTLIQKAPRRLSRAEEVQEIIASRKAGAQRFI